jgi:hypothetical protein
MRYARLLATVPSLFLCAVSPLSAQDSTPTFRTEAESAFVWGQDAPAGALSSTVQDPLTGLARHKLAYKGVEVGSSTGYEDQWVQDSKLLRHGYIVVTTSTTIVNNTDYPVSIEYGDASANGHTAALIGDKTSKTIPRLDNKKFDQLDCYRSSNLMKDAKLVNRDPDINPKGSPAAMNRIVLPPKSAVTIAAATATPEVGSWSGYYRYYVRVDHKDFVFPWPMSQMQPCGGAIY